MNFKSGHIIVFKGLLDYIESDDELAGILGHEISHAILQHTVKNYACYDQILFIILKAENLSRSAIIDILSVALVLTIWTIVPSDFAAIVVHYFSEKFLDVISNYKF